MANLPELHQLYVDDVDASTLAASKLNTATHSPRFVTYGDTTPTGISAWHVHWTNDGADGNQPYFSQPGIATDALLGSRVVAYTFGVPYEGPTASTGTIAITTNPTSGDGTNADTIRIGSTANIYRFVTSGFGLSAANDVLIGANTSESARNLAHAIQNHASTTGTQYHDGTEVHRSVRATWSSSTVSLTSRLVGTLGNSIQIIKGSNGAGGGGVYDFNGTGSSATVTLTSGGGQHLARGGAYYSMPSGWQMSASHGYRDEAYTRRLVGWTYTAPAAPTVQDSGAVGENVQLELMYGASTSLFTLTVSGATTQCLGRSVQSANGGGINIPAAQFVWARVPSATGATWQAPPGACWTLYFARNK